ncbi:MAG TPA: tRNA (guanosine(37)-N1)-methyltransferase TrmD [Trueperaceae bacterium]|nr:tRNA (guanosine(37)-N1)-methyltransferase TrmD [Trueperaceae bacterium]
MKFSVYSLFPNLIEYYLQDSLLAKASEKGLLEFNIQDLRKFATDKFKHVDDKPYGGGSGMVIRVDIADKAIEEVKNDYIAPDEVILLSPSGEKFDQKIAEELAQKKHIAILSARYEGFDARVESLVSRELSIGDYILMGGEIAALAIIEATARLVPDVIGDVNSHQQDSFSSGILDYPSYTRPEEYKGLKVPDILLSGHHAKIAAWRQEQAKKRTQLRRPDLLD